MTKILAIESSCDETAAAVIGDGYRLDSNIIASQIDIHQVYGGVVPEIASRHHLQAVVTTVQQAMSEAQCEFSDLDAVAVTQGPGLIGSLLVGVSYAKALAMACALPLIGVHHLQGHIHAAFLEHADLSYPFLALVVSGSHSDIVYVESFNHYRLLGQTLDDAAGEAFDKIARSLGLPYPGGPSIQQAALTGQAIYDFPRAHLGDSWDFSFSGLKSSVLNFLNQHKMKQIPYEVADVAASAQAAIVDILSAKAAAAARELQVSTLVLAGGVAANLSLRAALESRLPVDCRLVYPSPIFCTDNAAMIGAVALNKFAVNDFADYTLNAASNLPFYLPFTD